MSLTTAYGTGGTACKTTQSILLVGCPAKNSVNDVITKTQGTLLGRHTITLNMLPIIGKLRGRFVQAVVLLHLFDPVRDEPPTQGLDQDQCELYVSRKRMLERKFLDSFALLCAIEKDGNSVSATCVEEGTAQGTIIRLASNARVHNETMTNLRKVLRTLNGVADGGRCSHPSLHR